MRCVLACPYFIVAYMQSLEYLYISSRPAASCGTRRCCRAERAGGERWRGNESEREKEGESPSGVSAALMAPLTTSSVMVSLAL